jgi:spectrin beta
VSLLLHKHKNAEYQLDSLGRTLDSMIDQGNVLIRENLPGSEAVEPRMRSVQEYYDKLRQLAALRRQRLAGGVDYYQVISNLINIIYFVQFFTDADDVDAYLLDTLRVVSSDDVGKDEGTVQMLIRKHDDVSDDLVKFDNQIDLLYAQADGLPDDVSSF